MRHILLTSCIALLPGLAWAQSDNGASPAPPPPGYGMMNSPGGGGMMAGPGGGMMAGPGAEMGGNAMMGDWGKGHGMNGPDDMLLKFYAANTTHDGHLTLVQAKAGGLAPVADHFSQIDVKQRGYVTFYDIEAWHLDDMAQRMHQRAEQLRAMD